MKKRQNISALFTIAVFYLILESVFGITCPILFLTGISCAGCGMSRAWFCVLRMDFTGSTGQSFPIPSAFLDITDRNYAVSLLG